MSLKLSLIPATAAAIAPTDLMYLAKDMGAGVWLEHKLPVSVLNAAYQAAGNFLPLAGGTMSGAVLFGPDNTIDIGAAGATRPRTVYLGTSTNLALSSQVALRPNGTLEYGGVDLKFTENAFRRKLSQRVASTVAVKAVSTWTTRVSAADNAWYGVAWSPELGLFAAVSDGGAIGTKVQTSPDGITWTSRTAAVNNGWLSIVWSPQLGLFAAVAYDGGGNQVQTSPDGITWTARVAAINNDWNDIEWSPQLGLFVAVSNFGTAARVMTSPDGITWTSRTPPTTNAWSSVAWSPELGLFAAVSTDGAGNRVMTSPDGITWTTRTSAANNAWSSVAWSPELGLFAAVSTGGAGNRVMTSPDGITWTSRASAADNQWVAIAWSPELGQFAAVANSGTGNRIMTSPDGITWTTRASATDTVWQAIAWSPELGIFAATSASGASNRVMTSSPYGTFRLAASKLSSTGGALSGGLTFSPDCTFDIGATGAGRPRTIYLCTSAIIQRSALGATQAEGLQLVNSTAAAAGAQQLSSSIRLTGQGWKTDAAAASQAVDWRITNLPIQGAANPTSALLFDFSVNGGAFANRLALGSNGSLLLTAPVGQAPSLQVADLDITNANFSSIITLATGEFFRVQTYTTNGGSVINGFSASGQNTIPGLAFSGYCGGTAPTVAPIQFLAWKHDGGTNRTVVAATEPAIQFLNGLGVLATIRGDGLLQFAGATSAFPALGRNGTILEVLAADGAATASLAIYNTKTSTTNFERLDLRWTTNVAEIFTEKGSGGGTARDLVLGADATEVLRFTSAGATYAVAKTLGFRQGTNTRAGNATLVAGTVTVANTTVTANTIVMLTRKTSGGTLGTAITYTVTAATSFTINSDSALDTSTFSYVLIENPA